MTDYGDLSTTELAKLINDEYGVILATERTNLQKALGVGEKLIALRQRESKHGDWQDKLRAWCPRISYETATKYVRLCEKWPDIEIAARAKGVVTTDLTIDAALKLIAKPKSTDKGNGVNKSNRAVKGGVEPGNEPTVTLESFLENTAPDELFATLKDKYEEDQLRALAKLLVDHLTSVREAA